MTGRILARAVAPPGASREGDEPVGRDVATTWVGALEAEARVGTHRVLSDEPVEHGGDDTGPTPVDYLLVALTA